jgi:hypothetical protein
VTLFSDLNIVVNQQGKVEQRVCCPHCSKNSRDKSLGVNIDTGAYHCFRCEWKGKAGDVQQAPLQRIARIDDPGVAERKRERLRQTWAETVSLSHLTAFPVRRYLESRALGEVIKSPPIVLRAHAGLPCWDGTQLLGSFPAMVALFNGAHGYPVTLHVTYLRADGFAKASVPSPKKIMGVAIAGATKGGAIHLHEPRDKVLGIAEGIESALSLHLLQAIPVWSAYCAGNLEHVRLPSGLRELRIGVDIDTSGKGEQVAQSLAARVMKWSPRTEVYFVKPELDGPGDLNDDLRRHQQVM